MQANPRYLTVPVRRRTASGDGFIVGPILMPRLAVGQGMHQREVLSHVGRLRRLIEHGPEVHQPDDATLSGKPILGALLGPLRAIREPGPPQRFIGDTLDMPAPEETWRAGELPQLVIVTGGLGSGKTTLLNQLLRAPGMDRTLVFINELGAEAVDHLLVRECAPYADVRLLRNGCLCCKLGTDVLGALTAALNEPAPRSFDRILIETSGEAEPLELREALTSDRRFARRLDFLGVVTTLDMSAFDDVEALQPMARLQLAGADWVLPTKCDMLDAEALAAGLGRLTGQVWWATVLAGGHEQGASQLISQLSAQYTETRAQKPRPSPSAADARARHDHAITAINVERGALSLDAVRSFCELLMLCKGEELLRIKGEVQLDSGEHLLIQGVRGSLHELLILHRAEPGTRLTIIGKRLDRGGVHALLDLVRADVQCFRQ